MIWHFLEVWGVLVVAFAAGCVLGTLLYMVLAVSPLARLQVATADAIGDATGNLRARLGIGGEPPTPLRRPASQSRREAPMPLSPVGYGATRAAEWPETEVPFGEPAEAVGDVPDQEEPDWEGEGYWDDGADEAFEERPTSIAAPAPALTSVRSARAPEPEPEPEPALPAMRPLTLPGPRNGVPDNLQRVRGIGQKNEELLNSLGIYHFGQIAAWTPAEARWVAGHLAFPERLERDDWVGQAIILATGGDTGYVKAAERRRGSDETPAADAAP